MYPREFFKNRSNFPLAELKTFQGQWVAFSMDGRRIIAGDADLAKLDQLVVEAGEDPEKVALEHIDFDDFYLGEAELH
jgi:hypothetical protein